MPIIILFSIIPILLGEISFFWDVLLSSLIEIDPLFRHAYCLHCHHFSILKKNHGLQTRLCSWDFKFSWQWMWSSESSRCTAMFLIECRPMFQRYVLPPLSLIALMMEAAHASEMSVGIHLRTWQYIPEDSELRDYVP
jgi:hypothetical protein